MDVSSLYLSVALFTLRFGEIISGFNFTIVMISNIPDLLISLQVQAITLNDLSIASIVADGNGNQFRIQPIL